MSRLLVFDMDGTLLDSMTILQELAILTIEAYYGYDRDKARAAYLRTVGRPFIEQLETLFPGNPRNHRAAYDYEISHSQISPDMNVADDIDLLIPLIHSHQDFAALITSTDENILVSHTPQISSRTWNYMSGYRRFKPKLVQLTEAARYLNPEHTIYFGDTPYDERCARYVGAEFHMVTPATVVDTVHAFYAKETR